MGRQIRITTARGKTAFEEVSIDSTESNLFFLNETAQPHKISFANSNYKPSDLVVPAGVASIAPGASSVGFMPPFPQDGGENEETPYDIEYKCTLHAGEKGIIHVFDPLSPLTRANIGSGDATDPKRLKDATVGKAYVDLVAWGGKPKYVVSDVWWTVDSPEKWQGAGFIPGLALAEVDGDLKVRGKPTAAGAYRFTFTVRDSMGKNLQGVHYKVVIVKAGAY